MNPEEVRQHLSAYLDAELDESTRRAVEEALAASPELRAELDALRRTAECVRSLPRTSAPAGFAQRVAAVLQADAANAAPRAAWRPWRTVALAAAGVLIVVGALILAPARTPREKAAKSSPTMEKVDLPATEELAKAGAKAPATGEALWESPRQATASVDEAAKAPLPGPGKPKPQAAPPDDRTAGYHGVADAARVGKELAPTKQIAGAMPQAPRVMRTPGAPEPPGAVPTEAKTRTASKSKGARAFVEGAIAAPAQGEPEKAKDADGGLGQNTVASNEPDPQRRAQAPNDTDMLGEILRNHPEGGQPLAGRRADDAPRKFGAAPVREREVEMVYKNLFQTVAEVRSVFGAAQVPYALQPVGAGEFVVEATIAESEAPILVARLTEVAREVRKAPALTAGAMAATTAPAAAPPPMAPRPVVNGEHPEGGQGGGAGERVRLVLRFRPATEPARSAPAEKRPHPSQEGR